MQRTVESWLRKERDEASKVEVYIELEFETN